MNERANELIKSIPDLRYDASTGQFETDRRALYDLVELIVQECSRVIVNGGYWSGGPLGPKRQCTPPEIAQMIKQHFGVEE